MQDTIGIYIPDPTYGQDYDTDEGERRASEAFRRELQSEYHLAFEFTSIGTGAAQAAYFTLLSLGSWPYLALALAVFFQGKRIKENLEAWIELFQKITPFFHRKPTLDHSGAAIIAVSELMSALKPPPSSFRLIGYVRKNWWDKQEGKEDPGFIDAIEPPADRVTSITIHVFQIQADERHFRVFVEGTDVRLKEVEPRTSGQP